MTSNAVQNPTLRPHPAAALSSLYVDMADLCEAQDAALMQIMAVAKMAGSTLWCETEESMLDVSHALEAIQKIAALAAAQIDATQIEIEDARMAA